MGKRIVILSSNDAHHRYLAALLQSRFNVVAHVVEPGASQRRRLLKIGRYVDYSYWMYHHHLRRSILGLNAYRDSYFADLPRVPPEGLCPVTTVDWINDPSVARLLRDLSPDVTIIICTSILKKELLEAAGGVVINVHGGHLPHYRGNHCFFFALYNGDFDKIGSTIHFVDPSIDTGDIIESVAPAIYPTNNAERLYCRDEKLAIHRLAEWLEHLERGGTLPRRPQTVRTRLHRTRDRKPHHDVLLWLRRKTGQIVVPFRPEPPRAKAGGEREDTRGLHAPGSDE